MKKLRNGSQVLIFLIHGREETAPFVPTGPNLGGGSGLLRSFPLLFSLLGCPPHSLFFSATFLCLPVYYMNTICPQDNVRSPYSYSLRKIHMNWLKTKIVLASVCHLFLLRHADSTGKWDISKQTELGLL